MVGPAAPIVLTGEEQEMLSQWSHASAEPHRQVERARAILLAHEGLSTREIARRLQTRPARVSKRRQRFARERLAGLSDAQRKSEPKTYDQAPKNES